MSSVGRIHSIETLGTVDGPGIRTVIFFQGCPLRCHYCHNPDTWDPGGGEAQSVHEILALVQRYIPYFKASGGGVTLSGGEPGLQPAFAARLLKEMQEADIHTALDTSGYVIPPHEDQLLTHANLVILDIKHMDRDRYADLTGQKLDRTLNFARKVSEKNIPLWIRQVLVPGWTDDPAQLEALADFCSRLQTLERLEILPYHRLGVHKWKGLGLPYPFTQIRTPTEKDHHHAIRILREAVPGLPVVG